MFNLVDFDYVNEKDRKLTELFLSPSTTTKKYILGINSLTKAILKHVEVDGIIDDFSRVQRSRKKEILSIDDVPFDSIILSVSTGSPLEVKNTLDAKGYTNFNYLSFYRYSKLPLVAPPFMLDFEEDFRQNHEEYTYLYDLLEDELSREVFTKVLNFKISFDFDFMHGFTNNHDEQYFDRAIVPKIKNICFVDGGAYVGDTIPQIIKNFSDYKKIYAIEPNNLHINIAKRDFGDIENIEFINCGLGAKEELNYTNEQENQNNCDHNYQATEINTIDNIVKEKVDFIKLDIEGAEQDAIDGAKETIKKYKPILAICIYHKAEDWYRIPKKILSIESEYKVYLRHYMEGIFESVLYFIPKKR
ncbi:putative methyltransferase, FkbM family [Sulfurimonas gotlandica GD1]|uniref:Putative methyltransferase, FkbM family n=1 Tax=Sulfurimonas gotlandica (strain DSM 19862 / JCM 16533 / GD1) TaxID=929558 RepID=B6BJX9_SULGG|nr:FkbM family methyltransferase [Sulfurimonas gotlandica]EDZ62575.1 probable methyltransferase, putative [Sulfurimonas gotlandica GD1]EHP31382.1 putative methyltransferase, FkbM family [Sulfurimonas gotlandica GD1]